MNETDFTDWTRVDDEAERNRLEEMRDEDGKPVYQAMAKLEEDRQVYYYKLRHLVTSAEVIDILMHLEACNEHSALTASDPKDILYWEHEAALNRKALSIVAGTENSDEVQ